MALDPAGEGGGELGQEFARAAGGLVTVVIDHAGDTAELGFGLVHACHVLDDHLLP
ncbi:MAG: hypothetical protein JWP36_2140, partial [Paucimonas sp.]|nr:hypothetical protein [Paucimonas sp.]